MSTDQVSQALTSAELKKFEEDGVLSFDPGIPEDVINRAISDMEQHFSFKGEETFDEFGVKYTPGPNPRITWAWRVSDAVKEIALAPRVHAVLTELYGREPIPFQTLNFKNGTEQALHVDGMYFNSEPLGWMCGVWVALEDIDMDNGPLIYLPGTHKQPPAHPDDLGIERSQFDSYNDFLLERTKLDGLRVKEQAERHDREPQYGTIPKGQALVWAAHVVHGGAPQRDRSRTRHSQVTHYYFEGDFRHGWPLRREGDRSYYDYPAWITPDAPPKVTPSVVKEAIDTYVPDGANVLVASDGSWEMVQVESRQASHFPQSEDGQHVPVEQVSGAEAVEQLEHLRAAGAEYLVIPGNRAYVLAGHFAELQAHVEGRYRSVLRDGSRAVIFKLN
jgi:hypothetical protein